MCPQRYGHSQLDTWAALLQPSYGWKSIYQGTSVNKELRRLMNPGVASDIDHWRR